MGLDGDIPPKLHRLTLDAELESPADDETLPELVETVEYHSGCWYCGARSIRRLARRRSTTATCTSYRRMQHDHDGGLQWRGHSTPL